MAICLHDTITECVERHDLREARFKAHGGCDDCEVAVVRSVLRSVIVDVGPRSRFVTYDQKLDSAA
jgi:hypothetical protein